MSIPELTITRLAGRADLPLLVVGPSLGTSAERLWGETAALLGGDLQVLGWDLPGHGASTATTDPFTLAELAAGVVAALDREVAPGTRFVHAGDSIGGVVTLQLGVDAPGRVLGLAALCTGALIGTPDGWAARAEQVRTGGTASLLPDMPARWFAPGFEARRPEVAAALLGDLPGIDAASYALACEALAGFDLRERLREIRTPLLVISGSDDLATPPALGREVAGGAPGAQFLQLDGVGHLAPAEAPNTVATAVLALARRATGLTAGAAHAAGMRTRRQVLGDEHVDRAVAGTTAITQDYQDLITRFAWNEIWNRPGLDRRSRSVGVLTALVAGRHFEELEFHLPAALRNGLTREEIVEVLLQTAIYVGVPAANSAFAVANRVLRDG